MAEVLVWPLLFDGVVAYFAEEEIDIRCQFGWTAPAHQPGGALASVGVVSPRRVVWVPGDDSNGAAGVMLGPKSPGRLPEPPIDTLDELFTLYFVGVDSTDTADERKQYTAARLVFDEWRRAIQYAAYGSAETGGRFAVLDVSWKNDLVKFKARGAALRALVSAQAMIPDTTPTYITTTATAALQGRLDTSADDEHATPEADGAVTTIPEP